jgi:thymidylate synthase
MTTIIKGKTIDDVFIKACKELLRSGKKAEPRNLATLELLNTVIEIQDITNTIINIPERKLNHTYLKAEMDWYMSYSLNPDKIAKHAKLWNSIKNPDGTVNSNYGYIAFAQPIESYKYRSQYAWCLDQLKTDPAIINFNQPHHKFIGVKDFVCTVYAQFLLRNNKLNMYTYMRSNDLIYGFSYDVPFFTYIQKKLLSDLNKLNNYKLGIYTHTATSLHVYSKHFEMLKTIANTY